MTASIFNPQQIIIFFHYYFIISQHIELFLNICLLLQGVYAEGARWYSGEPGGGQLQDHSG